MSSRVVRWGIIVFFVIAIIQPGNKLLAEGTKEIMQRPNHNSRLIFDADFGGFALFGAKKEDRLHIRINEVGEKLYYGLGISILTDEEGQHLANDMLYRIIDPDGQVVVSTRLQPFPDTGYIHTYQQALAGPIQFNPDGYNPLMLVCNKKGDYYIEFTFPDVYNQGRREFTYFDFTVVDKNDQIVPGRIWSESWMFTVSEKGGYPFENPFYGKVYILADDGIVTSVDFNGMKPFVFTLFANGTGVRNTGNAVRDRKSVPAKLTYPQYKVFLNDPDPIAFPSGSFGEFDAPSTITGVGSSYCINVSPTKPGAIQVLIDFNRTPGYQANSSDILLVKNVEKGPNCIEWDGKDGLGQPLDKCAGPLSFIVTYAGGLTHMPIYDVENNEHGFIVELVRPSTASSKLLLYWDDSNISGYSNPPSDGCDGSLGCHNFYNFFGDTCTINTWWYSVSDIVDSLVLYETGVSMGGVVVQHQTCSNKEDGSIEVIGSTGLLPLSYTIGSANYQSYGLFEGLTANEYAISVRDGNNCIETKTVNIDLNTFIEADFQMNSPGPYTDIEFHYSGSGATEFLWDFGDNETSTEQNPFHQYLYDSVYYVKLLAESGSPDFCADSTVKEIEIYPPLYIYAPTAFTPDGDNLNDTFEIFGSGMNSFEIAIFSRYGNQLFYSNNIENSWDGSCSEGLCNTGVYAFVISARDWKGMTHQKKGTVTLVRP